MACKRIDRPGFYVEPTIVAVPRQLAITCKDLREGQWRNDTPSRHLSI